MSHSFSCRLSPHSFDCTTMKLAALKSQKCVGGDATAAQKPSQTAWWIVNLQSRMARLQLSHPSTTSSWTLCKLQNVFIIAMCPITRVCASAARAVTQHWLFDVENFLQSPPTVSATVIIHIHELTSHIFCRDCRECVMSLSRACSSFPMRGWGLQFHIRAATWNKSTLTIEEALGISYNMTCECHVDHFLSSFARVGELHSYARDKALSQKKTWDASLNREGGILMGKLTFHTRTVRYDVESVLLNETRAFMKITLSIQKVWRSEFHFLSSFYVFVDWNLSLLRSSTAIINFFLTMFSDR